MHSCGIFNTKYTQDIAIIREKRHWVILILVLAFVFSGPITLSSYWLALFNRVGIIIIIVLGLQLLLGYCGQISLGTSAFVGFGAYMTAILSGKLGLPFIVIMPCAAFITGIFGLAFGLPALRVKGFYLAVFTIAAQYVFVFVVVHMPTHITGGPWGLNVPYAKIGNFVFDSENRLYLPIMIITIGAIFFCKNLVRSRPGRAFIAIRDNDLSAEIMGINVYYYKLLAFFVSSVFAGLAGTLWAYKTRFVGIEQFTLWTSIWYLGMLIVGGMGSVTGAVMGAVTLSGFEELVNIFGPKMSVLLPHLGGGITYVTVNIIFSILIIVSLLLEPRGLAHRWQLFRSWYRIWPFPY
jgi:branched-chain amino acid transport system permease protein